MLSPRWMSADERIFRAWLSWRKAILLVAGLLISVYAVGVLWYVLTLPDIGMRCAFTLDQNYQSRAPVANFIDPAYLRSQPQRDLTGATVVQVGERPVNSWLDFIRAVANRGEASGGQRETADDGSHRYQGGEEQVRVLLQTTAGEREAVWCVLGRLSLDDIIPSILWFVLQLGLFVVGALVFWKRPADRSAAQFFWLCIVTLGAYMGGYHWSRIATQPILFLGFILCCVLFPPLALHFYLVFPRPKRFLLRHPRKTYLAVYGPALIFLAAMLVPFVRIRWLYHHGADMQGQDEAVTWLFVLGFIYAGVALVWYLASVASMVHSYLYAADVRQRNQVKLILIAAVFALLPVGFTLYLAIDNFAEFNRGTPTWPMFLASIGFTVAFTISITRYRLMQLDQLLNSGMVYFLISFVAGLAYYAVVFLGMLLIGSRVIQGPSFSQALWVSSTALVLMIVLDLVRSRLRRVLDRRFYRDKYQLDRTLRKMGRTIGQLVDPPTLARRLLQVATELLNVGQGAVFLREGEPPYFRLTANLGPEPPLVELAPGCPLIDFLQSRAAVTTRPGLRETATEPVRTQLRLLGGEVAHSLVHEGKMLGLLVLGPKAAGAYSEEDLNLLAAFAQMTTLALENAAGHHAIESLNQELKDKVEKIAEQQRRIMVLQSQLQSEGGRAQGSGERDKSAELSNLAPDPWPLTPGMGIVGSSPPVRQLLQLVRKVAASQSAVLIRGESGTGKELLARAVHDSSPRAGRPFVKVHCAALSPGLLESELFGHVQGAFTGAIRNKVGRFELANGGTLFLDEIGDITLDVQTKLLRVLQETTFERVGSSDPIRVDVRIIAATHQDLEKLIATGRFREDLYYRLNVITIQVPPLRERAEDIAELAQHFLQQHGQRNGKAVQHLDDDALVALKSHPWPGNIRQLENVLERAVVVAGGPVITVQDLPPELTERLGWLKKEPLPDLVDPAAFKGIAAERTERERRECERLVRALAAASGNKAEAARALGLARSTLVSRLKKYGLS